MGWNDGVDYQQANGWYRPSLAGRPAPTLSYVGLVTLSNSGNTRTSSTVNIGNPAYIGTRRVIMACANSSNTNGPIIGATINGVSATVHVDFEPANINWVTIFSALVPSGTTNVTVTVTYTGTQFASMFGGVYNVDNSLLNSTTPTTGTGTSASSTSVATSAISTSADGFILGIETMSAGNTGLTVSGYTKDYLGGTNGGIGFSLGSLPGGSLTPTATWGTSVTAASIAAAAWR